MLPLGPHLPICHNRIQLPLISTAPAVPHQTAVIGPLPPGQPRSGSTGHSQLLSQPTPAHGTKHNTWGIGVCQQVVDQLMGPISAGGQPPYRFSSHVLSGFTSLSVVGQKTTHELPVTLA
eukprot:GHUV01021786.1.p1 GENE.GHUV01021786.1~~GHUV01021786.1.p1  ORF type:complete len:120 (-),score=10.51 GHUV01021786.1:1118-1477(-)